MKKSQNEEKNCHKLKKERKMATEKNVTDEMLKAPKNSKQKEKKKKTDTKRMQYMKKSQKARTIITN